MRLPTNLCANHWVMDRVAVEPPTCEHHGAPPKLRAHRLYWTMKSLIRLFAATMLTFNAVAAEPRDAAVDQWRALRVGLFIHWGPSSGLGLAESHSHARQSPLNPHGVLPAADYDQLYQKFNPTAYDPDAWLQLAHAAGMRYAVFVAKHHDGFAMFDSASSDYDVMATPYGRDVTKLFADACRRQGLALGFQISPKDWKHPDFATAQHDRYNTYYEAIIRKPGGVWLWGLGSSDERVPCISSGVRSCGPRRINCASRTS